MVNIVALTHFASPYPIGLLSRHVLRGLKRSVYSDLFKLWFKAGIVGL